MAALFVGNQPAVQVLAMLGVGALFVVAGCLLSDFLSGLLERFSRLGLACKVAVLFFVVQLTMFGGAKHGTNDVDGVTGTNGVELVEGGTNGVDDAENGEAVSSPLHNGIEPPLTSGEDTASPLPDADIVRNLAGTDHALSSPLLMGYDTASLTLELLRVDGQGNFTENREFGWRKGHKHMGNPFWLGFRRDYKRRILG